MELVAAIAGPLVGGAISMALWLNKKNSRSIEKGFDSISANIRSVERKVDDFRVDVAKNYVTNDDLMLHIKGEEDWHVSMNDQMMEVRTQLRDIRNSIDRYTIDGHR